MGKWQSGKPETSGWYEAHWNQNVMGRLVRYEGGLISTPTKGSGAVDGLLNGAL